MKTSELTKGMRLGRAVFTGNIIKKGNNEIGEFICDCGEHFFRRIYLLKPGQKLICNKEHFHGYSHKDKIFRVHHHMLDDVRDRGIAIDPGWKKFSVFKKWALENGFDEESGFVKIVRDDREKGFFPDNCRFGVEFPAHSILLMHNGIIMPIAWWARHVGMSKQLLCARLRRGMSADEAITEPIKEYKRKNGKEN